MQAAHRLAADRFGEETEGVDQERSLQQRTEGLDQRGMDQLQVPAFGHTRGQGEMKAELVKDIRVAPDLQIFLFLTAQHRGLAAGHFAQGQRCPVAIECADAEGGQGLQFRRMADRAKAEKIAVLGDFKGRQGQRPLAGGEIGESCDQGRLVDFFRQAERRDKRCLKAVISRSSGQLGEVLRINITETGTRQGLSAKSIPAEPPAPLLPEGGGGRWSKIDSVAHTKNLPFVKVPDRFFTSGCEQRPGFIIFCIMGGEF